jgi:stage II sporulation protein P
VTRIQKVLCVFLCMCMLGAAALAVSGFFFLPQKKTCHAQDFWKLVPLYAYCQQMDAKETFLEDDWTCEKIIESNQAYLENKVLDENLEEQETKEEEPSADEGTQKEGAQGVDAKETGEPFQETAVTPHPELDLSPEKLADFDYLMNHFFILDPNTSTDASQINAAQFLEKDMRLTGDSSSPQILIYHSHSQEDFTDTQPGDVETTVVGVGNYLTSLLQDRYGYQVIHLTDTFDVVDGEIDRNRAYDFAREKVEQVLEENPSIEVVIDLHRDGVDESRHLVTEIDGKPTAQIMCFNGLSYTVNNGPVDYLPNPYIQDNLAFSFQLEMQAAMYYPDLYRGIYLAGLRYNLHLRPKALLLEAGAQTNTVEEVKNAMEPFADILHRVLSGEGQLPQN